MKNIDELRKLEPHIIFLGSHPGIIQSILDYDYLLERKKPSVIAIVARGRKQERFFWGEEEIVIPVVGSIDDLKKSAAKTCNMVINVQSARRVLATTKAVFESLPNLKLINIFAEQTPEIHTLEITKLSQEKEVTVIGPSSVGILLPGHLKLGAIGGTQHPQLAAAGILSAGDTAVISTSGGMVNELIHTVTGNGLGVSFAMALGGDHFPATTPARAFLLAEADPKTKRIVYFGELGGADEYEIADLLDKKEITKEVIVYIAGTVAELFETPPQFGHAKAMAKTYNESAKAKKQALKTSGALVCDTFADLGSILQGRQAKDYVQKQDSPKIGQRRKGLIISHISGSKSGDVQLLGRDLLQTVESQSLASLILSMLIGKQVSSEKAIQFTDYVLRLLVDHGPNVSGALNTIVAARAGKDLVSSLTAGLLTIGPRFGGAINAAAGYWLQGATDQLSGKEFVESFKASGGIIPGIGHKKYRIDTPDPRVKALTQFANNKNGDSYLKFARSVEKITTAKKGNLILNVDGTIAAVMLDILESDLNLTQKELQELVDIEFFNALFVLSRSVGFTAHYFDQRRHDEGLLRLSDDDVRYLG